MWRSQQTSPCVLRIAGHSNTVPPRIDSHSKDRIIAINALPTAGPGLPPPLIARRNTRHCHIERRTVVLRYTDGDHAASRGVRHNGVACVREWRRPDNWHIPQYRPRVFVKCDHRESCERRLALLSPPGDNGVAVAVKGYGTRLKKGVRAGARVPPPFPSIRTEADNKKCGVMRTRGRPQKCPPR